MKSIHYLVFIFIIAYIIPPGGGQYRKSSKSHRTHGSPQRSRTAFPETNPQAQSGLRNHGDVFYGGRSRVFSTRNRTRGRGRHRRPPPRVSTTVKNTSYSHSSSHGGLSTERSYVVGSSGTDAEGRTLFNWDGRTYDGSPGSRNVVATKKTTKTTKITKTKTRYDGTSDPQSTSYTYTIKHPSVSTYQNSTIIGGKDSISGISTHNTHRSGSSVYESSGSSYSNSSHGGKYSGSFDSSVRIGVGEDYLKHTEDDLVYDYEEEEYDPQFSRGPVIAHEDKFHPFVIRGLGKSLGYEQRVTRPCESACYPQTGNLLIGRRDLLSATSTCGLYHKEKFCIVSHLKHRKKCFWCDSRDSFIGRPRYSHRIHNIEYRTDNLTKQRSWWQSENGKEHVSIQLDFEAEFHFTHLVIYFRTFRPASMFIERSYDFGKTWKVYRYFAYNCAESFPGVPRGPPTSITDVVCESRYSEVEPSHMGEVIFRVLQPNLRIDDPYGDEVQNLLKITNLRLNFTKLHTLGDQLLDIRPEIKEKYYYAIYDMMVRGSCSCYGHAKRCLPLPGASDVPNMIHVRCDCEHNTKGLNCKECKDFYNDLPWGPGVGKESNACKRCECNNHATRCHFDHNVYEATGRLSGGVCDECQDNTQGRHCESCLNYFFQDQTKSNQDHDICQPCNCELRGSVDDGICDSRTDVDAGLVAGRCHCKDHVDGLKCDRCKAGYWNFSEESSTGCDEIPEEYLTQPRSEWPVQECSCNLLGTVNNAGCDAYTGKCQCKRNVVGRDCNQCHDQHYGLSDHPDGCLSCRCDRGGAFDNDCDVISGQCRCRPHVSGRQCDRPEEGYFVPYLNYLTFEAELARGSELYCEEASLAQYRESVGGNCQVVMREPYRDGVETTWTGIGFMRVFDESRLEFEIENVESSMQYDLVIKYEPQFRGSWEGMRVRVERPGQVDPNGECANTRAVDDSWTVELSDRAREKAVFPTVCLEAGKAYKVVLEFSRSNAYTDAPSASILIDSVMLIPRAEQLPFYGGTPDRETAKQEYQHYRCSEPFYTGHGLATLPETCVKDHLDSIGLYVFKQSYSCQCDGTGSRSSLCDPYGGQCHCKPNVEGRRCDRCAPGTYGFGPEGCSPCECNSRGSLDNFCDQQTGKCKCRPNTYGRQCNECQPGFWNFPNCQRCDCNGHADACDLRTGYCLDCTDNTTGANCAVCEEGFYGDPRLDVNIACRQCPCPGTAESRHSFALRCGLDPRSKDVVCECHEGYAGSRCDVCADNYFGNPEVPGGRCSPCDCSNNVDISRPGNCDERNGECLQCLFNTAGPNCQRCRPGFYGDALNQQCRQCMCNLLGTDEDSGPCNHETGQCPCSDNVLGIECDRCSPNHWKLASGIGCEHCACDEVGAHEEQCNEQGSGVASRGDGGAGRHYDGQCRCKQGFGGRKCDQCQSNFFGNPRVECVPCNCNREGSQSLQCDHESGQCVCVRGMGGVKCDTCDRGFRGRAPYCEACGECFDNWDFVLEGLKERTTNLIESASQIKQRGATGAYKREFESMEAKLAEVQGILTSANMSSQSLEALDGTIEQLREELSLKSKRLEEFESSVDDTTQRISLASNALADLRLQADDLRNQAGDLKDKATKLQEANVEGALNLTRAAGDRSKEAQVEVEYTEVLLLESKRHRKRTENILIFKADRFNRTISENEDSLQDLSTAIQIMEDQIPELNQQVCDRRGNPCDGFCGGAGCGRCGGLSCNDGLVNTVLLALKFAEDNEQNLKMKEASADDLLRGISFAKKKSDSAYVLALAVLEASLRVHNSTEEYKVSVARLLSEIDEYFNAESARPEDIKELAHEILALQIKLRPEQITELAEKITLTIQSLTDIDTIIDATRNDLRTANGLKDRADRAKGRAEQTLDVAERVVAALNESASAQADAEDAISRATDDISATEGYLTQIASETTAAQDKANASRVGVLALGHRVDAVQAEFRINQRHLTDTMAAVDQASLIARKATSEAHILQDKYIQIEEQLEVKSKAAEEARIRADELKRRANKLSAEVIAKLDFLKDLRSMFEENEHLLDSYDVNISSLETRMAAYHSNILTHANFYTTCTGGAAGAGPGGVFTSNLIDI